MSQNFERADYNEMKERHNEEETDFIDKARDAADKDEAERSGWDWVENPDSKEKISELKVILRGDNSFFAVYHFRKEEDDGFSVKLLTNPSYARGDLGGEVFSDALHIVSPEGVSVVQHNTEAEVKEIMKKLTTLPLRSWSLSVEFKKGS